MAVKMLPGHSCTAFQTSSRLIAIEPPKLAPLARSSSKAHALSVARHTFSKCTVFNMLETRNGVYNVATYAPRVECRQDVNSSCIFSREEHTRMP
jgi:hypothetical protein